MTRFPKLSDEMRYHVALGAAYQKWHRFDEARCRAELSTHDEISFDIPATEKGRHYYVCRTRKDLALNFNNIIWLEYTGRRNAHGTWDVTPQEIRHRGFETEIIRPLNPKTDLSDTEVLALQKDARMIARAAEIFPRLVNGENIIDILAEPPPQTAPGLTVAEISL